MLGESLLVISEISCCSAWFTHKFETEKIFSSILVDGKLIGADFEFFYGSLAFPYNALWIHCGCVYFSSREAWGVLVYVSVACQFFSWWEYASRYQNRKKFKLYSITRVSVGLSQFPVPTSPRYIFKESVVFLCVAENSDRQWQSPPCVLVLDQVIWRIFFVSFMAVPLSQHSTLRWIAKHLSFSAPSTINLHSSHFSPPRRAWIFKTMFFRELLFWMWGTWVLDVAG